MQNSEQQASSLWYKINRKDIFLARDRITREFAYDNLDGIINSIQHADTLTFINNIRSGSTRLANYTDDELGVFAYHIYESRKNQSNNAAG